MRDWDPNTWLWGEARDMLDRAERLQRLLFRVQGGTVTAPAWSPLVDVFDQGHEVVVMVALPGVRPTQVEVVVEPHGMLVRGVCPLPPECRHAHIRQLEIPYGRFERRVPLPAGPFELIGQSFFNGCLVLTLGPVRAGGG